MDWTNFVRSYIIALTLGIRNYTKYLLAGVALFIANATFGVTLVSNQDGDFSDPTTWNIAKAPNANDSVVISVGHTVLLTATDTVKALVINGNFYWDGATTFNISSGGITINAGGVLSGNFNTASLGFIQNNSNNYIINNGSFDLNNIYLYNYLEFAKLE